MELAEHQIKLVEMENKGGGRQRELEKDLLEARMANARLMEDNESYQLLLSEKTLTGDFTKGDFMRDAHPETEKQPNTGLGSLADELESVDEDEADADPARKLEGEVKTLKDQNKALTLYIERIISRVLQHDGFEHVLDKNDDEEDKGGKGAGEKELPPTPPEKDDNSTQSFLQRTKSIISGQPPRSTPRSRPASMMPPPTMPHNSTANENPETAPSIPLRGQSVRVSHRRARSEQVDPAAASVVSQMYRGRNSGGPISPTAVGPGSRQSMFTGGNGYFSSASRAPSMSSQPDRDRAGRSSSPSVTSDVLDTASTTNTSSPPRSSSGMTNYPGAVMTQNKLRPLRLVSDAARLEEEEEAARKKANRGSWIPSTWFQRPSTGGSEPTQ